MRVRAALKTSAWTPVLASALAFAFVAAPLSLAPVPALAQIGIGLNITIAPPPLPVYEPPPLPGPGYIFTPGYWSYGEAGYYWVPGVWVEPPSVGLLWTPGYWGFANGVYGFNAGYWGPHVGFYGGINYGFGYTGGGYFGGGWRGGVFAYNANAFGGGNVFNNVRNVNVYHETINNVTVTRNSFNGPGGVEARPTPQQAAFQHEQHVQPTTQQLQHQRLAAADPQQRAALNHGVPAIAAAQRPGEFKGPGVVHANTAATRANTAADNRLLGAEHANTAAQNRNTAAERANTLAGQRDTAAERRVGAPPVNTAAERAGAAGRPPLVHAPSRPVMQHEPRVAPPLRPQGFGGAPHPMQGGMRPMGGPGMRPMAGPGPRPMGGPGPRPMGGPGPRPAPAPHPAPGPHGGGGPPHR